MDPVTSKTDVERKILTIWPKKIEPQSQIFDYQAQNLTLYFKL